MTHGERLDVCLVIPGRDCERTLAACLDSALPFLERGLIDEIVFVNDGSRDETLAIARRYPVRVVESGGRGPGAARNVGFRATRAALVWFVDSDCVIERDALERLKDTMHQLGAALVGGSYSNARPDSRTARLIHEEMVQRHRRMGKRATFAITANLLCRREVLEELGGFDERLKLAQDLDFAYRALAAGHVLGFDAESHVAHHHETRFVGYLKKQARQGYWRMHLYKKHPGRAKGDSYSGLVDYAQPPLAVLAATSWGVGVIGLPFAPALSVPAFAVSGVSSVATVLLQLPMAVSLGATVSKSDQVSYVAFGAVRALARGAGMVVGLAHVGRELASRNARGAFAEREEPSG